MQILGTNRKPWVARKIALSYIDTSPRENSFLKDVVDYEPLPLESYHGSPGPKVTVKEKEELPKEMLEAEKEWLTHTLEAKSNWIKQIKKAESFEEFAEGIAEITGMPKEVVLKSRPVKKWEKFAEHPRKYIDEFIEGLKESIKTHEWIKGYREAFGG